MCTASQSCSLSDPEQNFLAPVRIGQHIREVLTAHVRVDEQVLDDRVVLERPDTGDGPVGIVWRYRRKERVEPLAYLSAAAGPSLLGCERRRSDQLLTLRGVLP